MTGRHLSLLWFRALGVLRTLLVLRFRCFEVTTIWQHGIDKTVTTKAEIFHNKRPCAAILKCAERCCAVREQYRYRRCQTALRWSLWVDWDQGPMKILVIVFPHPLGHSCLLILTLPPQTKRATNKNQNQKDTFLHVQTKSAIFDKFSLFLQLRPFSLQKLCFAENTIKIVHFQQNTTFVDHW